MDFMKASFGRSWKLIVFTTAIGVGCAVNAHGQASKNQGDGIPSQQSDAGKSATKGYAARNAVMMAPARPAVEKGLKYLASRQQEDGAFATSGYGRNAAVVALAGMAWLADGSTPGRGPYGEQVGRVSEY